MTAGLARVIRRAAELRAGAEERCDLCAAPLPAEHQHLLDTDRGAVLCSCRACAVLFRQRAASEGHYRLIGRRRVRLGEVATAALGVPVGLAYFVARPDSTVGAHYPSPMGATDWEVDPGAWAALVRQHPALGGLEPDVEALLVNTAWGAREHWIVPVDDCFRLVAVIRREWTGLSGGGTVWPRITSFFAELTERPA